MRFRISLTALILLSLPSGAFASELCTASVLHDVAARENPGSILHRGETRRYITQFVRDRNGTFFCSHGGFCYPTDAIIDGQRVEAQHLLDCSIDLAHPDRMGDEMIYPLSVDRSRAAPIDLRQYDVENQVTSLGLHGASAQYAAEAYVRRPTSLCGVLVRNALEGNPVARRRLIEAGDNECTAR
jgi:hypothetical protein